MDDYEDLVVDGGDEEEYVSQARWWSPGSLLTSGTSAISALILAYSGLGIWLGFPVAEALLGFPEGPDDLADRTLVGAMVVLLLLIGALWLAKRVLAGDDEHMPQWAPHVPGAPVVIAGVAVVMALLTIAGSLLADTPRFSGRPL